MLILSTFLGDIFIGFILGDIFTSKLVCKEFGIKNDLNTSWDSIFNAIHERLE